MLELAATTMAPADTDADTLLVGLIDGEGASADVDGAVAALLASGDAKTTFKHLAVGHADAVRVVTVGLGARAALDPERARVAGAAALARLREVGADTIVLVLPDNVAFDIGTGLAEGLALASYRFEAFKGATAADGTAEARPTRALLPVADDEQAAVVRETAVVLRAVAHGRDLQNTPANTMTPTALADVARALAVHNHVSVEVEGRDGLISRGMGCFAGVAQGSAQEPALITIRYDHPGAGDRPVLGLVGKAVTFDSGGISIKPSAKMHEMKFDMSGGAAVLAATQAIIELGLPLRLVSVIGATENLPSSTAVKPGDVLTAADGTTVEVNNTDAEGRLVLADCLLHAREQGAERLVDLATLTGAIIVGLGSTYAGLMSNDDDWAESVLQSATATGELAWRLPLHAEYDALIKGEVADIVNATESRKAGSITAAAFLARFAGDVPWVHLDIAGTAWGLDRAYAKKGGSGFGVRLLVDLARAHGGGGPRSAS